MSFTPEPVPGPDAPLRAALRYGLIGLAVLVVGSIAIATAVAGTPGMWGAVLGSAIGGGFVLTTAVSAVVASKLTPSTGAYVMLGGWFAKMLIALVVVGVLRRFDFYSGPALFFTVVGAVLLVLGAEMYGAVRQRVPYVTTRAGDGETGQEQQ